MQANQRLEKNDIVTALMDLNLPPSEYWIIMGAALVLHGVRKVTSDIDLAVSDDLFDRFLNSGHAPLVSRSGRSKVIIAAAITGYKDWTPSSWIIKQGVQLAALESIVEEKKALSRKKDLRDIEAIRRYQIQYFGAET